MATKAGEQAVATTDFLAAVVAWQAVEAAWLAAGAAWLDDQEDREDNRASLQNHPTIGRADHLAFACWVPILEQPGSVASQWRVEEEEPYQATTAVATYMLEQHLQH